MEKTEERLMTLYICITCLLIRLALFCLYNLSKRKSEINKDREVVGKSKRQRKTAEKD